MDGNQFHGSIGLFKMVHQSLKKKNMSLKGSHNQP